MQLNSDEVCKCFNTHSWPYHAYSHAINRHFQVCCQHTCRGSTINTHLQHVINTPTGEPLINTYRHAAHNHSQKRHQQTLTGVPSTDTKALSLLEMTSSETVWAFLASPANFSSLSLPSWLSLTSGQTETKAEAHHPSPLFIWMHLPSSHLSLPSFFLFTHFIYLL